jgi:hypothetical protein
MSGISSSPNSSLEKEIPLMQNKEEGEKSHEEEQF